MIPTPVVRKTLGQITDEGIMNRQESSKIINRIKQSANRLVNGLLKYPSHVPDLTFSAVRETVVTNSRPEYTVEFSPREGTTMISLPPRADFRPNDHQ